MALVSLFKQDNYDLPGLQKAVAALLAPLGGLEAFVGSGQQVVLKPNLVLGFAPERGVNTHPALVRVVTEMALDLGAQVAVGDSPGMGSCRSVAQKVGLVDALQGLPVTWLEFTPQEHIDSGRTYHRLTLARELLDADVVINLAKMKTHGQMGMTLAVKNMFGAVVGMEKFAWHHRAGRDKMVFARMLYEICMTIAPELSIVDGILAMDGNGPTAGEPNPVGLLAAGADPCAIDATLYRVAGQDPEQSWLLQAAVEQGNIDWRSTKTCGADPDMLRPARWNMPETQSVIMGLPPFLLRVPLVHRWFRKQIAARPVVDPDRCVQCGACIAICPPQVMTRSERGIAIDRSKCIGCFCCHELCPHHAIDLQKGLLGRLLDRWDPARKRGGN